MNLPHNQCDLGVIAQIYRMAILVYDSAGEVVQRFSPNPDSDEILFVVSSCKEQLFNQCLQSKRTQLVMSHINQLWAGVPVLDEADTLTNLIVLGPAHISERAKQLAFDHINTSLASSRHRDELLEALEQASICPFVEFSKLISLAYATVYGKPLDDALLTMQDLSKERIGLAKEIHDYQDGQRSLEDAYQQNFDFEQYLMECIREGNLERMKRILGTATYDVAALDAHIDPIRQWKNRFIITLALTVRAAIGGGLNPQVAYILSDLYVERIEDAYREPTILQLYREMLYEFVTRVRELRHTRHYSKLVNDCCNFVNERLRENIRVTDVAAAVGFNAHYVAKKFKDETGQSLKSYIKQAKIAEAKSLLRYSELSIIEISELLSFSSQSFFTASFRQELGITPHKYREQSG